MHRSIGRWLLRQPAINTVARRWLERARPVVRDVLATPPAALHPLSAATTIPEITPLSPRPSERPSQQTRLTLLVPGLSERHVFGGIATALQLFDRLRGAFAEVRIVVLDELHVEPRRDAYYSDWPVFSLGDVATRDPEGPHVLVAGDRAGRTLPVHGADCFLATIWWSAHHAHRLLDWQESQLPRSTRRLAYLIQDFEPGFYPWSARFALADATYRRPERTLAVINSSFLADYLEAQGIAFARSWVFEPQLNPALRRHLDGAEVLHKQRTILVYGRPGTDRNAFPLLVAGLRTWVAEDQLSAQWRLVSAGEAHDDLDLGRGVRLQSLGKLPLEAYADLLTTSAVGVTLMISPHPSYPPLEMAAFGCRVVTNRFANKDLSALSAQIESVERLDPAGIAAGIARACSAAERDGLRAAPPPRLGAFLAAGDPFAFANELANMLQ